MQLRKSAMIMKSSYDLITTSKSSTDDDDHDDSQWTNLPSDILRLIANQFLVDPVNRTCFQDVWKLRADWILNADEPPWLLTNLRDSSKPIIIYPSITSCHHVRVCNFQKNSNFRERLSRAVVLVSKFGWLLLAERGGGTTTCFFLWNPFTSAKLQLPPTADELYPSSLATFTCNPNNYSQDCVFFLVNTQDRRSVRILTCKVGDDSWEKHLFECHHDVDAIMWKQETLFCLLNDGSLFGFSLGHKSWTVLIIEGHVDGYPGLGHYGRYLVEFWDEGSMQLFQLLHANNGDWWLCHFDVQRSRWVDGGLFWYHLDARAFFLNSVTKSWFFIPTLGKMGDHPLYARMYLQTRGVEGELQEIQTGVYHSKLHLYDPKYSLNMGVWVSPSYCSGFP